ncbi:hypothetical protein [Campylobacter molothri]|uniref:hypothetical protein n=1 Tax=Campylobacter molothri TaxID=1032242 RepID=UPI001E0D957F|nr:hypothetical protein [Campylobacter sp. RM9759]
MDRKIIIANRFDGLGERLIALLNAMYLSDMCQADFKFIWNAMDETNPNVAGEHIIFPSVPRKELFFNEKFIEKHFFENYKEEYFDHILWWHKNNNIKEIIKALFYEKPIIQCNLAIPIGNYFKDIKNEEYREKIKKYWNSISFSEEIKEAIKYANQISEELHEYSVLHIRGGDIVYRSDLLYLLTSIALPVHLAIEIIKMHKKKIIIMGNDIELNSSLKDKFNNGNVFISGDFLSNKKFNPTQKAIFDIIVMSKSKKIYFSGHSGFSNLAYLIGCCNPVYIYEFYSTEKKYSIISNNMKNYQFNHYHQSFSCMYLYIYGKELNLPLDIQLKNIKLAMQLRKDAFIYKVLFIDILLQAEKYTEAQDYLLKLNNNDILLYLKDLLYEAHGVKGDFVYYFAFTNYFKINNIQNYPLLLYIAYFIAYNLIKTNNKVIERDMNIFLHNYSLNYDVIEKYDFLYEKKQDILNVLSRYFFINLKNNFLGVIMTRIYIQNYLSYRLGQVMIANSKNMLKMILIPLHLFIVFLAYKQEKKSIKPELIKRYINKEELIKQKQLLVYQLGEALIRAHKNWYKGGYFKLIFDIIKIKKEFKNKGK